MKPSSYHTLCGVSARRVLALFVVLLVIGMGGAPQALAAAPVDWNVYNGWDIQSFTVTGAPPGMGGTLKKGLALTGQWKLLKGQQRPAFNAKLLAEDLARIRLFLAVRGYPAAVIVPTAEAWPERRQLALVLTIQAGEPVRVGAIKFSGWPAGVAAPDTANQHFLRVGEVFVDETVAAGTAALREYLRNAGYAEVKLEYEMKPMGPGRVALHFTVIAGDFFVIDEVVVSGCSEDLRPLAARVINIRPGTEYAAQLLLDASLDLRLTQLFRQVSLKLETITPGHLRLLAELSDSRMHIWEAAVGTWTDNPWMVRSSWTHRNIFERGRGLNARGSFATHEMNAGVGMFWLGWLSPRAQTRVGLDLIAEREDAYDATEFRAELVQSFRPRNRDILNLGTALSENRIDERIADSSDIPEAQGRLWEFWVDRKWDRTNDPLFPESGGFLKLSGTVAEPWVFSAVPYASVQIDAALYRPLPAGMVLTGRTRLGAAIPFQDNTTLFANRRFYAGGYNSHRGYTRHGLGPRDDSGDSRGGEAVLLLSGELRMPLFWILEAGVFADAGNVWRTLAGASLTDFPVAVGATLGARSPLGPLRVGYAVNIADEVPGQSRELWHFGIGYPW